MKAGFIVLAIPLIFASCARTYSSLRQLEALEEGAPNPTTVEELENAIKKYDERAEDLVLTEGQVGIWYKILGLRYLDRQMYGKALECFRTALTYYPSNANLYYYVGLCAGYLANTSMDYDAEGPSGSFAIQKMNYLRLSESAFLSALRADPECYEAMYGIGVLYVFELGEPEQAVSHLEKFIAAEPEDINAMFVLARAYYSTYQFDKAVALYDRIIELSPSESLVREAEANKSQVLSTHF